MASVPLSRDKVPISAAAFPHCSIIAVDVELSTWLLRRRHRLPGAEEKARRPHRHPHPNLLIHLLIYLIHLLMMSQMLLSAQAPQLLLVNAPVNHRFHHLCRLTSPPPPAWLMTREEEEEEEKGQEEPLQPQHCRWGADAGVHPRQPCAVEC